MLKMSLRIVIIVIEKGWNRDGFEQDDLPFGGSKIGGQMRPWRFMELLSRLSWGVA